MEFKSLHGISCFTCQCVNVGLLVAVKASICHKNVIPTKKDWNCFFSKNLGQLSQVNETCSPKTSGNHGPRPTLDQKNL